uniref:Uncharacterized protein n=1 Tax=Rhodosorus marinus TaxID=101924 RepID=A0A7S2ZHL8_9RHOD|mmetsp:Transcript_17402/g.70589  ORF Transcript_17402/g.70589 Transcript_17402/m.70589 type:complete len:359 (+) Transcript_17402:363-1439(+)|eukprot:CAMPEP_0113969954 /NCGR_PEP_ID=MMETSP0011_2-20120614/10731_1 /TAXON_ID=101924 /ORGANISM="Rhodosorus marinus" /LENGTH=358 /DNA_ID=CAMNT_0000983923 /DNA_START=316 /DNA_END=1392 /DNA_ORIENTATION=+ /assembly_acc=CAM_ASM_000156
MQRKPNKELIGFRDDRDVFLNEAGRLASAGLIQKSRPPQTLGKVTGSFSGGLLPKTKGRRNERAEADERHEINSLKLQLHEVRFQAASDKADKEMALEQAQKLIRAHKQKSKEVAVLKKHIQELKSHGVTLQAPGKPVASSPSLSVPSPPVHNRAPPRSFKLEDSSGSSFLPDENSRHNQSLSNRQDVGATVARFESAQGTSISPIGALRKSAEAEKDVDCARCATAADYNVLKKSNHELEAAVHLRENMIREMEGKLMVSETRLESARSMLEEKSPDDTFASVHESPGVNSVLMPSLDKATAEVNDLVDAVRLERSLLEADISGAKIRVANLEELRALRATRSEKLHEYLGKIRPVR